MAANFNKSLLCGTVTRDPEVKYVGANKTAVTTLGLAINDRRKGANGEWVETATFIDVECWGRTAEVAGEYAKKASNVLIEGHLELDTWEKDGQKRSKLKVVCERMQLLGGKPQGDRQSSTPRQSAPVEVDDSEVPF